MKWDSGELKESFDAAAKAHPKLNLAAAGLQTAGVIIALTGGLPFLTGALLPIYAIGLSLGAASTLGDAISGFNKKRDAQNLVQLATLELAESVEQLKTDLTDTKQELKVLREGKQNQPAQRIVPASRKRPSLG